MHTEEQAKTLWCPHTRAANGEEHVVAVNRKQASGNGCIGSACAAWRWADPTTRYATPTARKGFCGLAGKPLM
jgi:hypothetical protein